MILESCYCRLVSPSEDPGPFVHVHRDCDFDSREISMAKGLSHGKRAQVPGEHLYADSGLAELVGPVLSVMTTTTAA